MTAAIVSGDLFVPTALGDDGFAVHVADDQDAAARFDLRVLGDVLIDVRQFLDVGDVQGGKGGRFDGVFRVHQSPPLVRTRPSARDHNDFRLACSRRRRSGMRPVMKCLPFIAGTRI
jgi:hypothetical protein